LAYASRLRLNVRQEASTVSETLTRHVSLGEHRQEEVVERRVLWIDQVAVAFERDVPEVGARTGPDRDLEDDIGLASLLGVNLAGDLGWGGGIFRG
jgi:hypothetical protein